MITFRVLCIYVCVHMYSVFSPVCIFRPYKYPMEFSTHFFQKPEFELLIPKIREQKFFPHLWVINIVQDVILQKGYPMIYGLCHQNWKIWSISYIKELRKLREFFWRCIFIMADFTRLRAVLDIFARIFPQLTCPDAENCHHLSNVFLE